MFVRWLGVASTVGLFIALSACDKGYDVVVEVTVPVEVQQAFSPSNPGLVVNHSTVIGRLCSPTSSPVVFRVKEYPIGVCSTHKASNDAFYGDAYVFDPASFQITYGADGDSDAVTCGETAEVHGHGGHDVQIYDVFPPLTDSDKVAAGSGTGTCAGATYSLQIDVSLR